jgi:hypothetical protein
MTRQTKRLRVLLVMFLAGLVMASGVLYIASLDYAALYPELAGLRLPIYIAVLVGLGPMIVAVKVVFDLLRVVDLGEAFSLRTVRLLRRLKGLFGITVAYLVLGLVGVSVAIWGAMGQTHPRSSWAGSQPRSWRSSSSPWPRCSRGCSQRRSSSARTTS